MFNKHHISVCICTYKRPELLRRLLSKLEEQETGSFFDYSMVVVDNDKYESAREIVESFARQAKISVTYYVEPEQNIAFARNMAVAHANGDFVAFIDDDEIPIDDWLQRMRATILKYGVDGVLGPVKPIFEIAPPNWLIKAGVFDRPCDKTGAVIDWRETGTGNVLARLSVFEDIEGPFNEQLGSGGEDTDFFRRATEAGKVFIWCEEAPAYEVVPVERTQLLFQLKRALMRGKASLAGPAGDTCGIMKSLAACALYTMLLPVFLMMGRHVFVKYLISDLDHMGKVLALCGVSLIGEKYIIK